MDHDWFSIRIVSSIQTPNSYNVSRGYSQRHVLIFGTCHHFAVGSRNLLLKAVAVFTYMYSRWFITNNLQRQMELFTDRSNNLSRYIFRV